MSNKKDKLPLKEKIKRFFTNWMDSMILDFFEEDDHEEEERIQIIAENIVEENKHYRREEEIIFPRLKVKGITGTPWLLKKEHKRRKSQKRTFLKYVENPKENEDQLIDLVNSMSYILREHVFKENTILYPIAIEQSDEWGTIRKEAKKIGCCQFQPL